MSNNSSIDKSSTNYNKLDFEQRVEKLVFIDPILLSILLARSALRSLPLIGKHLGSKLWSSLEYSKTNTDVRATFLLSIYCTISGVIKEALSSPELRKRDKVTQSYVNSLMEFTREKRFHHVGAADSAYMAAYAAEASYAEASYKISEAVSSLFYQIRDDSILNVLYEEMADAESGKPIREIWLSPLWPKSMPSNIRKIYNEKFVVEIEKLELNTRKRSPEVADAIRKVKFHYDAKVREVDDNFLASKTLASENPIELIDKLNRDKLVNGLASLLTHKDNSEHLTIGLLGRARS